jgi:cullin-4
MMDNLGQLYSLLERRRLGSKLKPAFGAWIDLTGTAIIFDEKEQDQMVARLLGFKQKLDNIWRTSFHKDDELGRQLRDSFETFINKTKKTTGTYNTGNSKTGEMIAKYLDILMKAGAKAIPASMISSGGPKLAAPGPDAEDEGGDDDEGMDEDTEVNNQLDAVLDLFRFVHGKAVFEAFYKKDLARRLLMGRSASNDAEKNMLARLKTECGSGFTQNLEQMFKDIELARDEMNAYKERLANNERKAAIDLTVNILSASAWPSYPDVHVNIPVEIKRTIDNFENHYQQKHSGRKLQWKHALAHCQLKADFPRGKKELVVSSFQAIVLLLFNGRRDDEQLSYKYIKDEAGLSMFNLMRDVRRVTY